MSSRNNKKNTKRVLYILLSFFAIIVIVGLGYFFKDEWLPNNSSEQVTVNNDEPELNDQLENNNTENEEVEPDLEPEPEPETFTDIRIAAAGDIMFHMGQVEGAYNSSTGNYDFVPVFADVIQYFTEADLYLANYKNTDVCHDRSYHG